MTLREYFSNKPHGSKAEMARALGITKTWMGQLINLHKVPSPELAVEIERITGGQVRLVDLRPDIFKEAK